MQQRRPVVLATAAAVVLVIAVVAALITWGYVRGQTPSGSPLAVAVVFAAVLTAGAVSLVILAGRPELDPVGRGEQSRSLLGGPDGAPAPVADATRGGTGVSDRPSGTTDFATIDSGPADHAGTDVDPPTAEQPRTRAGAMARERSPRTALDPLGRRYGRHARTEAGPDPDELPVPSELHHPLPSDLAATLHDQLFTHRSSVRD